MNDVGGIGLMRWPCSGKIQREDTKKVCPRIS